MTAMDIGTRTSAPGPSASAGGMAATIVAMEVIRIGRKRIGQASRMASWAFFPCSLIWLVNSTSKIEFFFTIPIRRTIPIML